MRGFLLYFLALVLILFSFCSCKKEYSYEGGSHSSGYLIKDLNSDCSLITVAGHYVIGKNLTDSNFLQVVVHVNRAGSYSITSDRINGYSFAASGNFTDTGQIQVKLSAVGRPLNVGTNVFNLLYDSSNCQVQVNIVDSLVNAVTTTNPDHFPLAENNRWVYDDLAYSKDSIINTIKGNAVVNSSSHYVMDDYISFFPATNQSYYRKSGSDYLEYEAVSVFTSALDYAPSIYDDLVFLKENCSTGEAWYSNTYSGRTAVGIQVMVLRYLFQCIDGDATVVINGKTFLHVCKMQMIPEVANVGASLKPTGEIHTAYYAKGVGLIYSESFNGIRTHPEQQIRSWRIY